MRKAHAMSTTAIAPVSTEEARRALLNAKCACGAPKGLRLALCYGCFRMLTPGMQSDLYLLIGQGFEKAYAVALQWIREERD